MRKKWFAVLSILVATGLVFAAKDLSAKDPYKYVNIKIDLNSEMTARTNNGKVRDQGFKNYFAQDKDKMPASFIQLNLGMKPNEDPHQVSIKGNGVLKIGNETYSFALEDQVLPKFTLPDGTVFYSGGLN